MKTQPNLALQCTLNAMMCKESDLLWLWAIFHQISHTYTHKIEY